MGLPNFETQLVLKEVCAASNALAAQERFEENIDLLNEWQVVFGEMSDVNGLRLMNTPLGNSGVATSLFRGKVLWIIDAEFIQSCNSGPVPFQVGTAMFLETNAASCVRTMAYEYPSAVARERSVFINSLGERVLNLNPMLYLWENHRSWHDDQTVNLCKQTVAAIHALSASGGLLTAEWGKRYRSDFRESAEYFANALVDEFQVQLKQGLARELSQQLDLMELLLVRTQLIALGSRKKAPHKIAELVRFMHEELAVMALRELIVCSDILQRSGDCRMANKLNSLQNNSKPLELLRNCAWDLYVPRLLDALSADVPEQAHHLDFYLPEVITFDGDVCDILRTTQLRAMAVHRPTKTSLPFFDNDMAEWLGNRVGNRRIVELEVYFTEGAAADRASRRSRQAIKDLLGEDRAKLLHLLKQLGSR